ncbi:MAG: SRPBCC domain-containing protein [Asticcacaulis sp.]|nr:SRPBCC domain-containing protein [Asticcacaulis sp.]
MSDSVSDKGIEIVSRRHFTVSPRRLFDAFADPAQLVQWWGPADFSNRIDLFDFRVGGRMHLTMTSGQGNSFDNVKAFVEIAPDRIVMHHIQPMHDFTHAMLFDEADGGTDLTWRLDFVPGHGDEDLKRFIAAANEQNFDRLQTFLEENP